ncbi:hypothetical protein OG927_33610 (plasmid) [Streptomyces clavifer]|uniref:hypothetical protein n=1 Tax=Streptomyces clavifer TaxID=68188 RepID=UPI002E8227A7|nr:hypothetical protein [Streptomyces clavifer]WUC25854.1 hypothetical protein OG927_00020 [Streptomyces clavifer]WUC32327.1 hypothetical protein OG927_33610 [Streptomyces clavifer]
MSSWKFGKEQEKFARLVLLDLIDQALCKEAVSGEVSDLPGNQGGWPSGRPPAGACPLDDSETLQITQLLDRRQLKRLVELDALLERDAKDEISSAELRRVAEIVESLGDDKGAYLWWKRAAVSGDEDAKCYLEILDEELEVRDYPGEDIPLDVQKSIAHLMSNSLMHFCIRERETGNDLKDAFEEIEKFLANPDQVADGGRRI